MSAASPAPLPREPYPSGMPDGIDGRPPSPRRPALTVAGDPGSRAAGGTHAAPGPGAELASGGSRPHVRLVPRTEPVASPLRADTPAHERPPVLGSPEALARRRLPARAADAWGDAVVPRGEPLPDPTRLCCAVVQAAVEGLRGVRPLAQLTRWVTPEVYDRLALRARLVQEATVAPSSARAGIRRVRVLRIGDSAAEATVVVDDGPRVRAVALRVEEHRGRWRTTALEIG